MSWWASGWSGTVIPTIAPMRGPQMPGGADDDVGRDLAAVRDDRPDPAVVGADAGHGVLAEERAPPSVARRACASDTRTALASPSVGTW